MGLPVTRIGKGDRGKVMALSEKLDAWVRRNGSGTLSVHHKEAFASLNKTLSRTTELLEGARRQQRNFLLVEIAISKRLMHLATLSEKPEERSRRKAAARRAYDVANEHLLRAQFSPELKELRAELRELKRALQKLGESF